MNDNQIHYIQELQKEALTSCFKNMMLLLDSMLQDRREALEVAEGNDIFKIQGEIRTIKRLLDIQKRRKVSKAYDGGYSV